MLNDMYRKNVLFNLTVSLLLHFISYFDFILYSLFIIIQCTERMKFDIKK